MKACTLRRGIGAVLVITVAVTAIHDSLAAQKKAVAIDTAQIPNWSPDDLNFFLHGSMSTEVVPEPVLRAFIKIYPDLFPRRDLTDLGLIPDPDFGWPIGFSRKEVKHLGSLPAVGLNCAACHVAEIHSSKGPPVRVLGATSHFDAEAFFGSIIIATFRTADPANMKNFLAAYLNKIERPSDAKGRAVFDGKWGEESKQIAQALSADPFGTQEVQPGELHNISTTDLKLDLEKIGSPEGGPVTHLANSILKLFHNMRAALHVPDQPPKKAPPSSGPGRNDAFGLLSAGPFNAPQPYAPVKYGLVWNVSNRHWVHWDGNTRSPLGRNLLASLGLGAPLHGKHGELDFAMVKRQTDLSEMIQAPRYPYQIDQDAAKRGAAHYTTKCASCHGGTESDKRLHSVAEVGTDPLRAKLFTKEQAARFNKFLAELESTGYQAPPEEGLRSTGKYWAASLEGVWARSPYLHNGSVRTMRELLTPPAQRAKTFHRGSQDYDDIQMGYTDAGPYFFDASSRGNSNAGHNYGTALTADQKHDLIEYLKTL
jgi:processive rubber oxygenase RoxA-like protein